MINVSTINQYGLNAYINTGAAPTPPVLAPGATIPSIKITNTRPLTKVVILN